MSDAPRGGLEGVVAGDTAISTLEHGLSYRGYAIEDLAGTAGFEEVAYLLLYGEAPGREVLWSFRQRLGEEAFLHPPILDVLRRIPGNVPIMDVLRTGASLLGHFDPDLYVGTHGANIRKAESLLAKLPTVLAAAWRLRQGKTPIGPERLRSRAGNLLWMLLGAEPTPTAVKALDAAMVLYAEHEFNSSTFAARVVASTLSDVFSSVTAAIGALKGSLHGGANERAMEMLLEAGSPARAEAWVRDALARKTRIMGFGHRIYKTADPRAEILATLCGPLAKEVGREDLEETAAIVERIVREEKGLPPNLDWPAARLFYYLGLPIEIYTPLFVISRTAGWCAHFIEQHEHNRLIRPRSNYVGPAPRKWVPLEERA